MSFVATGRTWAAGASAAMVALLATPLAAAEGPTSYACDATNRLVCAGVEVGGQVSCASVISPVADCSWTAGWIFIGFSPAFIPGRANAAGAYTVDVCSSFDGCGELASANWNTTCAWVGTNACTDDDSDGETVPTIPLDMGECVTITVTMSAASTAWVPETPFPPLATADHDAADEAAGQVCHLDDGR